MQTTCCMAGKKTAPRRSRLVDSVCTQGGRLVTGLVMGDGDAVEAVVARTQEGEEEVYAADAVIFAISISGWWAGGLALCLALGWGKWSGRALFAWMEPQRASSVSEG
jgi:hypothetical protein